MPGFYSPQDFVLLNAGDDTKRLTFDLAGITTGNKRILNAPDLNGTIALLDAAGQHFSDTIVFDNTTTFGDDVTINANLLVTDPTTLQGGLLAQPFSSGAKAIEIIGPVGWTGDLLRLRDDAGSPVIYLRVNATGDVETSARSNLALAGNSTDPPVAGYIGRVNRTNQGADIASTKLTDATTAGMYVIQAVLEDTTNDVTAGTVTVTFGWTDDVGATTDATLTQTLITTGRARVTIPLYLASGNITYSVAHTGIFGSAKYALRVRCMYLG
jgi:hypothetical protein